MDMTFMDLSFYILDTIIFFMLLSMLRNSGKIEVKTKAGSRWVIPCVFWGIAVLGMFNYKGVFLYIQTGCLIVFGIMYLFMESGLSQDGIVVIGKLYRYEKLKRIQVDDNDHCVNFARHGAMAPLIFQPEQMKEVRNYLSRYAGVAKHNVRTRERNVK